MSTLDDRWGWRPIWAGLGWRPWFDSAGLRFVVALADHGIVWHAAGADGLRVGAWLGLPAAGAGRRHGGTFKMTLKRNRKRLGLVERLEERRLLSASNGHQANGLGHHGHDDAQSESVARLWNEALLDAIRIDTPRPTVHARNLFHTSLAMYDAWAAFDPKADGFLTEIDAFKKFRGHRWDAAAEEAISYAAYGVLTHRFAGSPGAVESLASFEALMDELGYDPDFTSTHGKSPAAIGNRIAEAVIEFGLGDGANETGGYADTSGYAPVNPPLDVTQSGTVLNDPNRWQPLIVAGNTQTFLTPHWGDVDAFAAERDEGGLYDGLPSPSESGTGSWATDLEVHRTEELLATDLEVHRTDVLGDPEPPPLLGGAGDAEFKDAILRVIRFSSVLDPAQDVTIDISPASKGDSALGTNDGDGHDLNPATGLPYEPNLVNQADWGRVLAEFWADGPNSETPPGHWNTIANEVTDQMEEIGIRKRIGGTGRSVDDLEWDVKLYFTLNGAVHDAAVSAWDAKEAYDYVRPISMIRYMGGLGQSSDPAGAAYDPSGLPLEDGLVEVITVATTAAGERHEHLAGHEGEIAIFAWAGHPDDPDDVGGVDWILPGDWLPYQAENFVTPPFAGFTSGHSTFSRASAEVLTHFTGDGYFPGGVGSFVAPADEFLNFEGGPTETVTLTWATYFDAADEAGLSRLYGGIHVDADDFQGRIVGSQVGIDAFELAQRYFRGRGQGRDLDWRGHKHGHRVIECLFDRIEELRVEKGSRSEQWGGRGDGDVGRGRSGGALRGGALRSAERSATIEKEPLDGLFARLGLGERR